MADLVLTDEQTEILDKARDGWSFVVEAGAGTGKTSTLARAAAITPGNSGLYLAYNRAIVDDAKGAFPDKIFCSTAHGVAYRAGGHHYQRMLSTGLIQGWQLAKFLGVRRWSHGEFKMSGPSVASLARRTVKRWAGSTDLDIVARHVPVPDNVRANEDAAADLREYVLRYAVRLWQLARNPGQGQVRFDHDWYLKLFSMSSLPGMDFSGTVPQLPVDMILFDECQDADPVIRHIFEGQLGRMQRIAVGDSQQSIYAWRGAENAIARFREGGAPMLPLTTSWRFGQVIADEANRWLDLLNAEIRLTGNPNIDSQLGPIDTSRRHAVLCRTNAGVIEAVIRAMEAGQPVAMVGCGKEVKSLATACEKLHGGKEVDHPALIGFSSWDELVNFTESEDCDDPTLRTLVRLSAAHGVDGLSKAINACVDERDAHVVASTAHKSKGRQWEQVRIGADFAGSQAGRKGESKDSGPTVPDLRLSYVAVTRARHTLDRSALTIDQITSPSTGETWNRFTNF